MLNLNDYVTYIKFTSIKIYFKDIIVITPRGNRIEPEQSISFNICFNHRIIEISIDI